MEGLPPNVIKVSENPLTFLITLPDGCTPGRFESAEAFGFAIKAINFVQFENSAFIGEVPNSFQFVPFKYEEGALTSMLAIKGE